MVYCLETNAEPRLLELQRIFRRKQARQFQRLKALPFTVFLLQIPPFLYKSPQIPYLSRFIFCYSDYSLLFTLFSVQIPHFHIRFLCTNPLRSRTFSRLFSTKSLRFITFLYGFLLFTTCLYKFLLLTSF